MKKLFDNFAITALLMLVVSLADYVVIPLGGHELAMGFLITFVYFGAWVVLKGKGKI